MRTRTPALLSVSALALLMMVALGASPAGAVPVSGALDGHAHDRTAWGHTAPKSRSSAAQYTITPSVVGAPNGHGTISPDSPTTVFPDETPTFQFNPVIGYHTSVVLVDGSPVTLDWADQYTFPPVEADHTISVSFEADDVSPAQYTITPSVDGGHGTISPDTPQTVSAGSTPAFTFTPDSGYQVGVVSVDGTARTMTGVNQYMFPAVSADHTISVTFTPTGSSPTTFTITPSVVGGHGTISPDTAQTVSSGATPTFTFAPDGGYQVGVVSVDGVAVTMTASGQYTFPAVSANHTISVSFTPVAAPTPITVAAPSPATVKRGHMATLEFQVDGPATVTTADVTITIKTLAGRIVSRKAAKAVPLGSTQSLSFLCMLYRGRYQFYVSAVTPDGQSSTNTAYNTLTVR